MSIIHEYQSRASSRLLLRDLKFHRQLYGVPDLDMRQAGQASLGFASLMLTLSSTVVCV